ncbi:hypothetical protein [Lactococcus ileimucosae]|uniref:hypothetical protein n=1 Tax=Lactococcus ileimucosae TaxID=2941329 RepID=UPI002043232D|nr:hypothetical protein [Lactococcus ileimucosae]
MKKINIKAAKMSSWLVCGLILLSFSSTGLTSQTPAEAAEVLNPISPDTTVSPENPETIPAPQETRTEESKQSPSKSSEPIKKEKSEKEKSEKEKSEKENRKKKKAKYFFAPDTAVALQSSQKVRILDGEALQSTNTGRVLSSMSGRLLFGEK